MEQKVCSQCGKAYDSNTLYFYADNSKIDGLRPNCKICHNIYLPRKTTRRNGVYNPQPHAQFLNTVRIYERNKRKNDPVYRLKKSCRTRVNQALKGGFYKFDKTFTLIGCSPEFLKSHLESQFQAGMSWENYGKWHVDHVKPCASFNLSAQEEQLKCFHYSNLQPLWAEDNIKKRDKEIYEF